MKIAIVSPVEPREPVGNARSVARIAASLEERGARARVVVAGEERASVARELSEIAPDATILYHARRAGRFVDEARRLGAALVYLGGTDVDQDLGDPARREPVARAT